MKLISQILRLLKSGKVKIEHRLIRDYGYCYINERIIIRATLCESNKVRTLIHECVHWLYPELNEKTVLEIESDLFESLSVKEYGKLVFFLEVSE